MKRGSVSVGVGVGVWRRGLTMHHQKPALPRCVHVGMGERVRFCMCGCGVVDEPDKAPPKASAAKVCV